MGLNITKGILGMVGGTANAYADSMKEQRERSYEDLKAQTLYNQQVSLEGLRNTNKLSQQESLAKTQSGLRTEERTAQVKMTSEASAQERTLLKEEGKQTEYDSAKREAMMHPDFPEDPASQESFIKKISDNRWLAKQLKSKGIEASVQVQMIKSADEAWLNMDEDSKEKLIAKAGGDEAVAKGNYAAKNVSSWKQMLGVSKPSRISPDKDPSELKVAEEAKARKDVVGAGNRTEAMKLINQAKTTTDKRRWVAIIDEVYPEATEDKPQGVLSSGPNVDYGSSPDFNLKEAWRKFTTVPER